MRQASPRLAWGILALVLAVLAFGLVLPAIAHVAERQRQTAQLTELAGRQELIAAAGPALAQAVQAMERLPAEQQLAVAPASEAAVQAWLQEQVKAILTASGAAPSGLQPHAIREADGWRIYGLSIQFAGDTAALQRVLHAIESHRPLIALDAVTVRAGLRSGVQPLEISLSMQTFAAGGG